MTRRLATGLALLVLVLAGILSMPSVSFNDLSVQYMRSEACPDPNANPCE